MTTKIKFIKLSILLDNYPNNIELIKESYLKLLSELTETSELDTNLFLENIKKIHTMGCIIVCYTENPSLYGFKIVASGTIIIEPKIIRGGKNVGHIEDIVIKASYRGYKISQDILDLLKFEAREKNCYKVILDCDDSIKQVYKKSGFEEKGIQMAIYF
jgi:glucosamine-phosphate N-acetyltransferase